MKNFVASALVVAALAGSAFAQAVGYTGGTYSQDFDTLANTGTPAFVNDSTLDGWNLFRGPAAATQYTPGTGSSNSGSFYSFGAAGSTERALGSISSGTSGTQTYTLVLQNLTGNTLTSFSLNYDGEQWRDGGQGTFAPTLHSLTFDTLVTATVSDAILLGAGFTAVPALNFQGPISANTTTNGNALNGNVAPNRVANINGSVNVNWTPGSFLVLRWTDLNEAGNDHALALDNLSFSAVPTPGAVALAGVAGLVGIRRRRTA